MSVVGPILERLEDQIAWYDRKSLLDARAYKRIKIVEILAAASIPFLLAFHGPKFTFAVGGLGVAVLLCELLAQLNQYLQNSISYRAICESLKHEKFLYLERAGPYADVANPNRLLAERIEARVQQQHANWTSAEAQTELQKETESHSEHELRQQSADIKLHVHTPGGDAHRIEAPDDIRTEEFIHEVVSGLQLPSMDAEGRQVDWTIDDRNTGKTLNLDLTLAQNGVENGHHIYLRRQVTAGAVPLPRRSSDEITLHVHTPGGEMHLIDARNDIRTEAFIREVMSRLHLPSLDAYGHAVSWTIDNQNNGKNLDPNLTMAQNGTQHADHIYLRRQVTAGGPPPTHQSPVQFSVYCPENVEIGGWYTLLTYAHVPEATSDIQIQANQTLGREVAKQYFRTTGDSTRSISDEAEITVVPELSGCRVNPRQASFLWLEDWHTAEFRFQPTVELEGSGPHAAEGRIAFYVGPILVGEVMVSLQLLPPGKTTILAQQPRMMTVPGYEAVFVSYSHQDTGIVEELEKAYTVLGMQYLRDIKILRSGEKWNAALLEKIQEADVFQLCWSKAAKNSEYVTKEWHHALAQGRPSFIRPVYWENPMPDPPRELADIHFARLDWDVQRFRPSS
jgi:hypothetical protein